MSLDRWIERTLVVAGLLLLAGLTFHMYSTLSANAGAARVQAHQAKADADSARKDARVARGEAAAAKAELAAARRAAAASDARSTEAATRYRGIRDTVEITDTAAVRAVLAAADSAVSEAEQSRDLFRLALAEADSVIRAQESQIGALERENAALRRQISATERQIPSKFGRTLSAAKWVVVGVGIGAVLTR